MKIFLGVLLACAPFGNLKIHGRDFLEHGRNYLVDVKYPEIAGEPVFNAAVQQAVGTARKEFGHGETPRPGEPADNYLKGSYKAGALKSGIVTVILNYDEYTSGAAHPWGVIQTINYDGKNCRVLKLSDLFLPGANYVARVSEIAIADLMKNEYAEKTAIERGAGPDEKNFKNFTLTDDSLVLHFPMYQVAAGAAGEQTVEIPFAELAPLLKKR